MRFTNTRIPILVISAITTLVGAAVLLTALITQNMELHIIGLLYLILGELTDMPKDRTK